MFKLLKDLYDKIEGLRGKDLIVTLSAIFIIFTLIGLAVGYFTQVGLTVDEPEVYQPDINKTQPIEKVSYKGRIDYVNPNTYGVSYVLVNEDGEDVILLTAKDQKLTLSEGLFVTVTGVEKPKKPGQELGVLNVEEVTISNAAN